jgi:hypothetical protein
MARTLRLLQPYCETFLTASSIDFSVKEVVLVLAG